MITSVLVGSVNEVELDWYADGDVVRVIPRNQRRFEVQKDRAIEVLQRAGEADRFNQQFALLLDRLAAWVCDRQEKIANAILTLQDGALSFVVVRTEAKYDEGFQDDLAEIDFEIANDRDLDLIKMQTLALPHVAGEALLSFLDDRLILSYHGDRARSHPAGRLYGVEQRSLTFLSDSAKSALLKIDPASI